MTEASAEFVQRTAASLAAAGMPRMPALVLMSLMGSESASLTAGELAERLGASAAAISGAVRYLESVRMVHRHRDAGTRRDRWELADHTWYTASLRSAEAWSPMIGLARREVEDLPAGSAVAERISEMADFLDYVADALPRLLEEWRAHGR